MTLKTMAQRNILRVFSTLEKIFSSISRFWRAMVIGDSGGGGEVSSGMIIVYHDARVRNSQILLYLWADCGIVF